MHCLRPGIVHESSCVAVVQVSNGLMVIWPSRKLLRGSQRPDEKTLSTFPSLPNMFPGSQAKVRPRMVPKRLSTLGPWLLHFQSYPLVVFPSLSYMTKYRISFSFHYGIPVKLSLKKISLLSAAIGSLLYCCWIPLAYS